MKLQAIVGSVVAGVGVLLAGCHKPTKTESTGISPGEAARKLVPILDRTMAEQELRTIGLAYQNCNLTDPNGPRSLKDLAPYYENNRTITSHVEKGDIRVAWKIGNLPGNTIIAYQATPDKAGRRAVLTASYGVSIMDKAEFDAAPKAKGI